MPLKWLNQQGSCSCAYIINSCNQKGIYNTDTWKSSPDAYIIIPNVTTKHFLFNRFQKYSTKLFAIIIGFDNFLQHAKNLLPLTSCIPSFPYK